MSRTKDSDRDRGFAQGVAWAIGVLERALGETSAAEIVLSESGISKAAFRRACDPYDYKVVRRFFERDERWGKQTGRKRG